MMHKVSFEVVLDTDAIKAAATLQEWCSMLRIEDTLTPQTWEQVFSEIGRSVIGSHQYRAFCWTAINDQEQFRRFVLGQTDSVKVYDPPSKPVPQPRRAVRGRKGQAAITQG